jgi:multicopper oxidase
VPVVDRRTFLGLAASATLAGCATSGPTEGISAFVTPGGPEVRAAEQGRRPGRVRDFVLTAIANGLTWSYDGVVPGKELRVTAGEVVRARLDNRLPEATSIHWHGLALRNDADGVPGVTQEPIAAGAAHTYEFTAPHAGTYWYHPHSGPQFDRGLFGALVVEDPAEPLGYDQEWVVVLDDWLDADPDEALAELRKGMSGDHSMKHMLMGATSPLLGGDAGDVRYRDFRINGRTAADPQTLTAKPGTRVRIRLINAGGDTAFRVALDGHTMTLTHSDGFPLAHSETDALLIGMGERYDVLVTLKDGLFPLVALAEGKKAVARALVRTGSGRAPSADFRPRALDGRVARYGRLHPAEQVRLPARRPDRTITLQLTGSMSEYDWAFNGKPYDPAFREPIAAGERVRLRFVNTTTMWHPVHLHGHTYAHADTGIRKDTSIVLPGTTLETDFDADNPGIWMVHCHNVYHQESGMMTLLGYRIRP